MFALKVLLLSLLVAVTFAEWRWVEEYGDVYDDAPARNRMDMAREFYGPRYQTFEDDAPDAVKNLAKGKPTSQSSTAHGGASSRAVDGNTNSYWGGNSCSHTGYNGPQWWQVDLEKESAVKKVIIYNRRDCCSERLNNMKVTVSNNPNGGGQLCGKVANSRGKYKIEVNCPRTLNGQYVRISIPTAMLTLCEVQVMGCTDYHNQDLCKKAKDAGVCNPDNPKFRAIRAKVVEMASYCVKTCGKC